MALTAQSYEETLEVTANVFHAAADVIDERKIFLTRSGGGPPQSLLEPRGPIVDHLMAADLDRGAVADE